GIFQPEQEITTISTIENTSSYAIAIESYLDGTQENSLRIPSNDILVEDEFLFQFGGFDSVLVVFDDSVVIGHNRINVYDVARHIMDDDFWESTVVDETRFGRTVARRYVLGEADFQEALQKGRKQN
ncbi:MAG: hypothetical protein AAFR59_13080, partial [Bacteroidota bacterium]